jgi:hypothetical protein
MSMYVGALLLPTVNVKIHHLNVYVHSSSFASYVKYST